MSVPDFIEVYPGALPAATCEAIVARLQGSDALQPGQVGGGVHPDLKHSRDLSLAGRADWADVAQALNVVLFSDLLNRVPAATAYADDCARDGQKVFHDHGAVRTVVLSGMGSLP